MTGIDLFKALGGVKAVSYTHLAEKAFRVRLKERHAEVHLRQIGFVLRTGGSARADGITEVKRRKARHHRVKIDDAPVSYTHLFGLTR